MNTISVAVLGATGTVGQKFVRLLEGHPYFEVTELVASQRSAGRPYREVCNWKQDTRIPERQAEMTVKSLDDPLQSGLLFSGLDSSVAGEAEVAYAEKGHMVVSNSKNHRMDPDVPLVIPEINSEHLALLKQQRYSGGIVTNPNCSTMFLAMALAPLHRQFTVESVQTTTMQAISGAGYPGVASMDILGNVIPYIKSEEEKMEAETGKILGDWGEGSVTPAPFPVSAQCNRVPVYDGHTETVSVKLAESVTPDHAAQALRAFRGTPQERQLPSAPAQPLLVLDGADRPQPILDLWAGDGMAAVVGRIRSCPVTTIRMVVMGHNTVRGAAGAAILNAEALHELGYLSA
jgi:aspartate-semialdehyde dehydrogenase